MPAKAEGSKRAPIEVQRTSEREARPVRTARPRDSRVHEYVPTNDPRRRLRVPKGLAADVEFLPDDYVDRFFEIGEKWARRQLEIDALTDKQKKPEERTKAAGKKTQGLVRGFIVDPEGNEEGLDVLITPSTSIEIANERAFKRGDLTLFQQTTHPELVFQLRVPESMAGKNIAVTESMIRAFFMGAAAALGIGPDEFDHLYSMRRELNPDKDKIRDVIKGGQKVPGVKSSETWRIDVKPIPPEKP